MCYPWLILLLLLLSSKGVQGKIKFKIVEEIHIHQIFGLDAKLIEDDLVENDFYAKGVLYSILGMHPASNDSLKAPGLIYLDECIQDLKKLKERNKGIKQLGFKVVDGFFINEKDGYEWDSEYPEQYIEDTRALNIQRFISRYERPLHEIFGNITVYISGMKWRRIVPPGEELDE